MKRIWIKLFVELLDDDKIGPLPVWLKWRFVELLLVAAESDNAGILPPVTNLAWRLRTSEDDLVKSLRSLGEIGIVCESGDRWKVTSFEKRQAALTNTERVQAFRKRKVTEDETKRFTDVNEGDVNESISVSSSVSDSLEEGGTGGETIFRERFGKFNSQKESKRWLVLFEAVGKDAAESLADWALKKEIHLNNRPGLMDSLETAAKNWKTNGNGKHDPSIPLGATVSQKWLAKKQEARHG